MNTCWFLGANTAEGFCSRFEQLHPGGRVRKCVIIKGGPGYGKSTFMKQLRKAAESLGADTESYPCSSDPALSSVPCSPASGASGSPAPEDSPAEVCALVTGPEGAASRFSFHPARVICHTDMPNTTAQSRTKTAMPQLKRKGFFTRRALSRLWAGGA